MTKIKKNYIIVGMEMNKKFGVLNTILLIVSIILTGLNLFAYFCLFEIVDWIKISLIIVSSLAIVITIFLFFFKKFSWLRMFFIGIVLLSIFTWGYQLIVYLGYAEIFDSVEAMQEFIAKMGAWGIIVFVLIQILQVVLIPIPSMITTIAGAILFGPTLAMFLSLIAIIIASYIAFFMGRYLGEKVVSWIVGKEMCEKYSKLLFEKGKYLFFLMMLFPVFPDDLLCMIAGMTTMNLRFFTLTILITRPIAIIPTCYLGGGTIIPYSGWGLVVWGILIAIMIVLFILSYKYQDKIEKFVVRVSEKFSKKSKKNLALKQFDEKEAQKPNDKTDDVTSAKAQDEKPLKMNKIENNNDFKNK